MFSAKFTKGGLITASEDGPAPKSVASVAEPIWHFHQEFSFG